MTIVLAHRLTLGSLLPLLGICSCGPDSAQPSLGGAGIGMAGGPSPGGGAGAGGVGGGGGTASGAANGGTSSGGMSNAGTSSGGTPSAGASGTDAGGGGFGGAAPAGSPTFTQVVSIIQANCGSKCHSGEREDLINLAGPSDSLYARLTSPLDTDLCYRALPVQRGSAASSLLARVLKTEISTPCPLPRMPASCAQNNECLSDADIATIDGWINAGAFNN